MGPASVGLSDAENIREAAFSRSGDDYGAAIRHPLDPAEIEVAFGEGRPYRTCDVWASFGPIDADFAEPAAGRTQRGKVDPELGEETGAGWGEFSSIIANDNVLADSESISQVDRKATGKVKVANSGRIEFPCLTRQRAVTRSIFKSDGDDRVEHIYYLGRGQPEISVPSLPERRQQPRFRELRQVRAGGLRGDPGRKGKLMSGQCAAIEKR